MGFSVGYAEVRFPKLLLRLCFLLGYVRWLISWAFDKAGLGDLVESDAGPWPSEQEQPLQRLIPELQSVPAAVLIEEVLPVVLYKELSDGEEKCAVCLYEVEAADEVRRLSNCRHVFHRGCLDSWMGHDHRTCPLCRTPLIPAETRPAGPLNAAGLPDDSSPSRRHHHHFLF